MAEVPPEECNVVIRMEGGLVSAIWIIGDLHGSNKRRLTKAPIEAGGHVSPEMANMWFSTVDKNTVRPGHVFVMNVNGTGVKQLMGWYASLPSQDWNKM